MLTQALDPAAAAGAARRLDSGYELRIAARKGVVAASVASFRSYGALKVAEGRPVAEAIGLAGLLFPLSAAAQTAAALSAAEAALDVELAPAQIAARQMLVGFEAAAACAWRMGLVWPQLSAAVAGSRPVEQARAAADAAAEALFEGGDWARVGGGRVRPRLGRLCELLETVRDANQALAPALAEVIADAPALPGLESRGWPLLDDAGVERAAYALAHEESFAVRPHLSGRAVEDGPRAILRRRTGEPEGRGLDLWFRAQAQFAEQLPGWLGHMMRDLADAPPTKVGRRGSGRGWGMAVSARGRIVHWMAIEHGLVTAWRAIEPTDWNFAPRGPVARAAELLPADETLADAGRWLVAAFDPSAPCKVVAEGEP